jgi:hypothetical protein
MRGDLPHVLLGAVAVNAQLTAGACSVPLAEQLHGTTSHGFRIVKQRDGLTTTRAELETADRTFSPAFHTHGGGDYTIRKGQQPNVRQFNHD